MNNVGSKQLVDCGDKHYSNLFENDERQGKIQHITSKIDQIILFNWQNWLKKRKLIYRNVLHFTV